MIDWKIEWHEYYNHEECPVFKISCYAKSLAFTVEEKQGRKKVKKSVKTKLPQAIMVDWKQFVKYHDPKLMFRG